MTRHVVVGIGISSRATRDEIAALVRDALANAGADGAPVHIATRSSFADDPRLQLGHPLVGIDDHTLVEHSRPVDRAVGIPARVAETAAALVAGIDPSQVDVIRSAHVTVAVVTLDHVTIDDASIGAGTVGDLGRSEVTR